MTKSQRLLVDIGIGLFLFLALGVVYLFPPSTSGFYPKCFFHEWTGIHCAGCGGFRAMHHLVKGRWLEALHCNALAIFLLPSILVRILWMHVRNDVMHDQWSLRLQPRQEHWLAALIIGFMVVRNFPWWPFTLLAPY